MKLILRPAKAADAGAVAEVWLRSYAAALPTVSRAHSDDEVRAWIRDVVVPRYETWVAVADGAVVGMMALHDDWVEQLYLDPRWRGRGIGDRLVELAKQQRPDGLQLWTFQINAPACRFYERHGFVEVERTDGSGNEEREPDIRYAWRPQRCDDLTDIFEAPSDPEWVADRALDQSLVDPWDRADQVAADDERQWHGGPVAPGPDVRVDRVDRHRLDRHEDVGRAGCRDRQLPDPDRVGWPECGDVRDVHGLHCLIILAREPVLRGYAQQRRRCLPRAGLR